MVLSLLSFYENLKYFVYVLDMGLCIFRHVGRRSVGSVVRRVDQMKSS